MLDFVAQIYRNSHTCKPDAFLVKMHQTEFRNPQYMTPIGVILERRSGAHVT